MVAVFLTLSPLGPTYLGVYSIRCAGFQSRPMSSMFRIFVSHHAVLLTRKAALLCFNITAGLNGCRFVTVGSSIHRIWYFLLFGSWNPLYAYRRPLLVSGIIVIAEYSLMVFRLFYFLPDNLTKPEHHGITLS